jgi:hypothetical protein
MIKANNEDPDQMALVCLLIWMYTVCTWYNSHITRSKGLIENLLFHKSNAKKPCLMAYL